LRTIDPPVQVAVDPKPLQSNVRVHDTQRVALPEP
jgi:hypothetical protein